MLQSGDAYAGPAARTQAQAIITWSTTSARLPAANSSTPPAAGAASTPADHSFGDMFDRIIAAVTRQAAISRNRLQVARQDQAAGVTVLRISPAPPGSSSARRSVAVAATARHDESTATSTLRGDHDGMLSRLRFPIIDATRHQTRYRTAGCDLRGDFDANRLFAGSTIRLSRGRRHRA